MLPGAHRFHECLVFPDEAIVRRVHRLVHPILALEPGRTRRQVQPQAMPAGDDLQPRRVLVAEHTGAHQVGDGPAGESEVHGHGVVHVAVRHVGERTLVALGRNALGFAGQVAHQVKHMGRLLHDLSAR